MGNQRQLRREVLSINFKFKPTFILSLCLFNTTDIQKYIQPSATVIKLHEQRRTLKKDFKNKKNTCKVVAVFTDQLKMYFFTTD